MSATAEKHFNGMVSGRSLRAAAVMLGLEDDVDIDQLARLAVAIDETAHKDGAS